MTDFLSGINSIYWWISVVLVGIILNVTSSYFRDGIDKALSGVSTWWATRSKKKRSEREDLIGSLVGDSVGQAEFIAEEFRDRLRAIQAFVLACIIGVVVCTVKLDVLLKGEPLKHSTKIVFDFSYWFPVLFMFLGMKSFFDSLRIKQIVREAKRRERDLNN